MDKELFKNKARQELENTQKMILELKELTLPIKPENSIGRISRMDAINNKSVNDAALRNLIEKAKNIESALERVLERDFGICRKCQNPIPEGRLFLIPGTTLCVICA